MTSAYVFIRTIVFRLYSTSPGLIRRSGGEPLGNDLVARVFNREEDAMDAVMAGKIRAGDVVAIRYEGPKGGSGMREMLGVTGAIAQRGHARI